MLIYNYNRTSVREQYVLLTIEAKVRGIAHCKNILSNNSKYIVHKMYGVFFDLKFHFCIICSIYAQALIFRVIKFDNYIE